MQGVLLKFVHKIAPLLEIGIALLALLFPTMFVNYAHSIVTSFPFAPENSIAYAYGLLVIGTSAISAFVRKLHLAVGFKSSTKAAIFFDCFIVFAATLMIYSIAQSSQPNIKPESVVTPYVTYAISIFFCIGVGHAMSDIFSTIISKD